MQYLKDLPSHFTIPIILSLIILIIIGLKRKWFFSDRKRRWVAISLFVFSTVYLIVMSLAVIDEIQLQQVLNQYDINQDSIFSINEVSEDQQVAMNDLINDVGRNFAFITGAVAAFVLSLTSFFLGRIYEWIKRKNRT